MAASPKPNKERDPDDLTDADVRRVADIFAARLVSHLNARRIDRETLQTRTGGPNGPGSTPPSDDQAKLAHNEQTKLTATLLNGLALAFLVSGIVTTVTGAGSLPDPADQLIRALAWIVAGAVLHCMGRIILGSLR